MTTKNAILKTIRLKCLDCCAGTRSEISKCTVYTCTLWPYRLGVDPNPTKRGFARNATSTREVT